MDSGKPASLLQNLVKYYSLEELQSLAFALDVDFESLPASGKEGKARELLLQLSRTNLLPELIDIIELQRPFIDRQEITNDIQLETWSEALAFLFNEEELKTVSFELGTDYESLPAAGKAAKANELVCKLKRSQRLPELLELCQERRPNFADWDQLKLSCPRFSRTQLRLMAIAYVLLIAAAFLWIWWPPPLADGFNVVVAEIASIDENGRVSSSELGKEISQQLFEAIERETEQLPLSLRIQVREPALVGIVQGSDPDERAARAAKIADRQNATILIYGVISPDNSDQQIELEFYVSDKSFGYGSEVAGPDRLGKPITLDMNLDPTEQFELNDRLYGRAEALRHLVQGLANYYISRYELAAEEFRWAAGIPEWRESEGKEIVYFLQGQAYLRAYDQIINPEPLSEAKIAFVQAYDINADYARNYLGLGSILLMEAATLGPDQTAIGQVDEAKLLEARNWFYVGLNAPELVATAYVPIKAKYGLGLVHLIGFEKSGWHGQEAWDFFTEVVEAYEAEPVADLAWFASRSHAYLGRLAGHNDDWETMIVENRIAIDMLRQLPGDPPYEWIARFWAWVGLAEENLGEFNDARHAYEQAIELGTGTVSAQELAKWQGDLERLEEGGE